MKRTALAILLLLTGCGDEGGFDELETTGSSEPTLIPGEPSQRKIAPRANIQIDAPVALALNGGVVAIGTDSGVFAGNLGADTLSEIAVHPDQEGPKSTGKVRTLARRSGDGLLVLAENGLFHSASGYLLSSPLEQSIDPKSISALSARGLDSEEELWLVTSSGAAWVAGGSITKFSLKDVSAPITLAIGTEPGKAVVAAGDRAYLVDLHGQSASVIASDLGSIQGGDAEEDGTVHLATSVGLLSRSRSGEVTLRTFAPGGQKGTPVLSIGSAFGSVFALTGHGVVELEAAGATLVGEAAPKFGSVAVDASGDAWSVEDGTLYRYETSKPIGFADDVAPFFVAHCDKCHLAGATSAPDHEFSKYDVAKEWSDSIVRRLQATDATTMPPPNSEVLTAADYAVVLRWVKGGLLP